MKADPWTVEAATLGAKVGQSLRDLTNCWVREKVPTREQADAVIEAQIALAYLVTRARRSREHLEGGDE